MRAAAAVLLVLAGLAGLGATPVRAAADVQFTSLEATGTIAGPLLFRVAFTTDESVDRVELLTRLPSQDAAILHEADASEDGGRWTATVPVAGGDLPNTTYRYRFRVTTDAGEAMSEDASFTVVDDRFEWQTLEGESVHLHWAEGNTAFAERALTIGDDAVARISGLLGVEETEPIDFFVYADQAAFQEALGPGTREYVAGRAVPEIRTLFALIEPNEINSQWVDVVIPHELSHLVFDTAVDNPYREPPHWLNEGLATYLSEGGAAGWEDVLDQGLRRGTVVPLSALAAKFPPSEERFRLGYAEGVSAVDFFVREHGEERLVELVRSYARGLTDDEAFEEATGAGFAAFDAAWMAAIGLDAPPTFGPAPAPSGPVPAGWNGGPRATTAPRSLQPSGPAAPARTPPPLSSGDPGAPSAPSTAQDETLPVLLLLAAAAFAGAGLVLVLVALRRGGGTTG